MAQIDDLTRWLAAWRAGDRAAESQLMAAVYDDLRGIARRRLRAERPDHSLAPTGLVHEAYVRLTALRRIQWHNRAQFFAIASRVMRRILVDHARAQVARKRGGNPVLVTVMDELGARLPPDVDVLDLDRALTRFAAVYTRHAHLVDLRFFGGLTIEEASEVLGRSPAALKRDWTVARAWLFRELRGVRHEEERLRGAPHEASRPTGEDR